MCCYVMYCYCITLRPQLGSFASQLPLIIVPICSLETPKNIALEKISAFNVKIWDKHL